MKDFCLKCEFRNECTELCADVLEYAEQDKVEKDFDTDCIGDLWKLEELADKSSLSLAEMQDDRKLTLEEWKMVLEECKLTKQQIQCMFLHYWEKETHALIGKKLGITRQAVTKHIKYAKKKIEKMLKSG